VESFVVEQRDMGVQMEETVMELNVTARQVLESGDDDNKII
jgi:hypothetical protein